MHQFKMHLGMYLSIATEGGPPTHKEDQISGWCTRNMSVIKPKWNALACWEHHHHHHGLLPHDDDEDNHDHDDDDDDQHHHQESVCD